MPDNTPRKKLIEVDLPLEAINKESAREKSIRHGHPSTMHQWWARRPLASCRAVIFASIVDDPSSCPEEFPDQKVQVPERERLHKLMQRLVVWENSNDENLLAEARYEMARSVERSSDNPIPPPVFEHKYKDDPAETLRYLRDHAPTIYDPFCGGGSIPLEAQRLGFKAAGSDLNPIAVLITKALIEIPPKFADRPPINPDADPMGFTSGKSRTRTPWRGAAGLASDIRYYGQWIRDEAYKRIGHLYPKAKLDDGSEANVIAWLWARTIPCQNPACGIQMPMMKMFQLSKKSGNRHWTRPIIDRDAGTVSFQVQDHPTGVPAEATVNRNGATCLACGTSVRLDYVREQAKAGRIGEQMTAIVAEGNRKRIFLSPTREHAQAALKAKPRWRPDQTMPDDPTLVSGRGYSVSHWHQLFTERQLLTLTTFSDLVSEVRSLMAQDGADDRYVDAISTYLAFAIDRAAVSGCAYTRWENSRDVVVGAFARQAIPMIWDFAEANAFSQKTQNWMAQIEWIAKAVERLPANSNPGKANQADASSNTYPTDGPIIVTDPPYYDNISYAVISDFFYVWLRPLLRDTYPNLFASILTPKDEEMIADPRFESPKQRFENGLNRTLKLIRRSCSDEFPSSIVYGYKQQEEQRDGKTSTGWETMLNALIDAGFQTIATWPMRTELANRTNAMEANALASSVILVCRPRPEDAPSATRQQFLNELAAELPIALDQLTREGHIVPTDLAQAAIGPGMQIYSRYSSIETISGKPVTVRDALIAINREITRYDVLQEGELDPETQFCLNWMKQHRFNPGDYGSAEVVSQAKNIDISNLVDPHRLLTSERGQVQLLRLDDFNYERKYPDASMTAWEGCMRMAYDMRVDRENAQGMNGAAETYSRMDGRADSIERLARILYNYHENRGDAKSANLFNNLVTSWQDIQQHAVQTQTARQTTII